MQKGSPGSLSLHIHLQEQMALKLWLCASVPRSLKDVELESSEEEDGDGDVSRTAPGSRLDTVSWLCPSTHQEPLHQSPLTCCKHIVPHTAASAASNQVPKTQLGPMVN